MMKRGYAGWQITHALKGQSDEEKRRLLSKADLLKERLGKPEGKPILVADYKIDQKAVKLTRPKKVRITSKTLREDVAKRLHMAALTVEMPSGFPVRPDLNLPQAIRQGTEAALARQSVVRLD